MECSNRQTYSCITNETGCDITNMACGQTCTVKVAAEGRSCNSSAGVGSPVITGNHFEHNHSKIWGQKKHTLIKQGCIKLTDTEVKVKTFIMSRKNYILNKCYFKRIFPPKLLSSTIVFNIKSKLLWIKASAKWLNVNVNINKKNNDYWASNQHIRLISEESRDWSKDAENSAFHHNNILKYIKIKCCLETILQVKYNLSSITI